MSEINGIVAVDCDSVMFPINELAVLPFLSERLGREVLKQEVTSWDYGEIPGAKKLAYEVFKRPNLYDAYDLSAMPGAVDGLAVLRSQYRVLAVSSPFAEHATSKWSFLRRCGFKHEDVVLCGDKRLVQFDVLLDDAPMHLLDLSPRHAVVFDQPWNRVDELDDYERAYGWEDVPRKVARILK